MIKRLRLFLTVLVLLACNVAVYSQSANDHIFPASPTAKPYIDFDSKGFLVNGKRTFLVSAGLEYARVPHQLWYDRLLRLKRAGFNCAEIYTMWNFHEPQEGKFDFSGDHDLGAFLVQVKKLGMYAIVRVGPYYCAEWDNGGYPIWLKFKKGLRVREDNATFEQYADRFFDKLLPIVFNNQINKGGPVIMVQLENEHPNGWGTIMPDNYFKRLQSKALSLGLQVPYFFSGLHHSSDPAGDGALDDPSRLNPWFSTEFWSVWYSQYGAKPTDAGVYDRRTWKIIAHGGNGYNYYMAHGGSNFGYTNNDEDAASYDYGAAVGQAGDLRPLYYTFKRAAWFSRSFEEILENSTDATASFKNITADPTLKVTARSGKAGDLVFLDNPGATTLKANLKINEINSNIRISIGPGEIYPLVHNFYINKDVTIDWAFTRIYGIVKQGNTTTILVEAEQDEPVSLLFLVAGKAVIAQNATNIKIAGNKVDVNGTMNGSGVLAEYSFTTGKQNIRVLAMNRSAMDKTWVTETPSSDLIISGASYLGKVEFKNGKILADAEYPLTSKKEGPARVYFEKGSTLLLNENQKTLSAKAAIKLSPWEIKNAAVAAASGYEDKKWFKSKSPLQMGADGDLSPYAWYRTKLSIPETGKYTMQVDGGDNATAFIDGKRAAKWKIRDGEVSLNVKKGEHTLAIFTAHDGRDKLAAYLGPIDDVDKKGLSGNAVLKNGGPFISTLTNWYFIKAAKVDDVKQGPPVFDTAQWKKYTIGADAFGQKEGFGWFQTIIPAQREDLTKLILNFRSVDENATVFINGEQLSHHEGWNTPFSVEVNDPTILKKPMTLSVFIENYSNEGGIDQPVKINSIGDGTILTGWKMRGGPDNPDETIVWAKLVKNSSLGGPQFYRSQFTVPVIKGQHLIWRVHTNGLSYGSVWVNGHNLGRYPEKIGNDIGMYIPECWLKPGINKLVIYDEDGKRPDNVRILSEQAAGRVTYKLVTSLKN
ncbi:beta-galactosidase [Mucilaginibacter sp. BJC16-A38]|uniref:beta-galactosidase n=1 Tax=Mucilaginibacter phenanthrenivorans TaxID=1234842 RepID=UPI0021581329|nr:beta-galactosidase [Mucilaginibacter phenanthrenivorans]MCR8556596.1 beta-galactosidase [Mucilaginibacter phenanthrenivorans]